MSPDDPRHGTRRGYYAHRRAGQSACEACKRAAAAAQARHEHNRSHGINGRVDPTGTRRRLQALVACGYTWTTLDRYLSGRRMAEKFGSNRTTYVHPKTRDQVAAVYDLLRDVPPPASTSTERANVSKALRKAATQGWPTPDRWFDIDDPTEKPDPGYVERTGRAHGFRRDVDLVVVERILGGDLALMASASRPERVLVIDRWRNAGRSLAELERTTGINAAKYRSEVA